MRNLILIAVVLITIVTVGLGSVFLASKIIRPTSQSNTTSTNNLEASIRKSIQNLTSEDPQVFENSLSKELKDKIGRENLAQNLKLQRQLLGKVQELTFLSKPKENPDGSLSVQVQVKFEKAERPITSEVILVQEEGVWKILSTDLLSP